MKMVYLDNAATTAMRTEVIETLHQCLVENYANPSATYALGRKAKASLELARKQIAQLIGVPSSAIIFTSGGTEANNLILQSAVKDLEVAHIVTSKIEHHAVLNVVEALEKKGVKVTYLPISPNGTIDLQQLENALAASEETTLVSLMHANNEIGTILDVAKVNSLCKQYEAYFHSDMVQSFGHLNFKFDANGLHFASASAHKFYGPKGVGFAIIPKESGLKSMFEGGEQERGLRPGTESLALITAMSKALSLCYANYNEEQEAIKALKKYAVTELKKKIPEISFNALTDTFEHRKHNLLHIRLPIPQTKAATTLFQLDLAGICCSRGSACQSGSNKPSHVLAAFQSARELQWTSLRLSFSIFNTYKDIDRLIEALKNVIND